MQPTLSLHCMYTFGTLQVHSSSIWVSTALATFACKRKLYVDSIFYFLIVACLSSHSLSNSLAVEILEVRLNGAEWVDEWG